MENITEELLDMQEVGFSVVTPTKRPWEIYSIVANYDRQCFKIKELIIIINSDLVDLKAIQNNYKTRTDILIFQLSEHVSLGSCLNYAYTKAKYNYIAKFDDDDYYGPYYLREMYDAFKKYNCDLVCKESLFYYLFGEKKLLLVPSLIKVPQVTRRGAGATICMTKSAFNKVQYSDLKKGVDLDLFIHVRKLGLSIFSTSSYNFLCIRSENEKMHTWKISARSLQNRANREFGIIKMTLEEACKFVNEYKHY